MRSIRRKSACSCLSILARSYYALILLLSLPSLGAESLFPASTQSQRATIVSAGESRRFFSEANDLSLAPSRSILERVTGDFEEVDASLGVEVVFVSPQSGDTMDMASEAEVLLMISGLEGLHYFSASRNRMRVLFEESFVVDGPESLRRVADPAGVEPPDSFDMFVFQRDGTFGANLFQVDVEVTSSMVHMRFVNLTSFRYGPIRLISPYDLRLHIFLIRIGNGVYYYAAIGADSRGIGLLKGRISDSFYNRLSALYSWYSGAR